MAMEKITVIAEAGVNHNGSAETAFRMADAARDAGADYIKFQSFSAEALLVRGTPKAAYQTAAVGGEEDQYAMIRRLELTPEEQAALMAYCRSIGIGFLSSPFDCGSVALLKEMGLDRVKIPSGEILNTPYLRAIGNAFDRIILSTGMATLAEIEYALSVLDPDREKEIILLHCNTEYPTPFEDVNLSAMETLRRAFGVPVGYSDHTLGIEIPIAAAALGATVIEKHFTLDRSMPGPDHRASLEPQELARMVSAIAHTRAALGDGIKRASPSEAGNRGAIRKSIVAGTAIRRGEVFTEENLTVKRPGTGLSPIYWELLVGRPAQRDYQKDEMIEL